MNTPHKPGQKARIEGYGEYHGAIEAEGMIRGKVGKEGQGF